MKHKRFLILLSALLMQCNFVPYDVESRFQDSIGMTPPASATPADPNNFSFVHVTDIHVENGGNPHLSSLANNLVASDAFIVLTGDLTENGAHGNYLAYKNILDTTGLPYYSIPGNHDLWNLGWDSYKTVLGPSVYSITAGNLRIIALDSGTDTIGASQYAWLENELAQKTEPYCIVISHYNIFSPLIFESAQASNMEEVYGMLRMFEKYSVNYVLMGHSHIYEHKLVNGVNYLVGDDLKVHAGPDSKYLNRLTLSGGQITHQKIPLN